MSVLLVGEGGSLRLAVARRLIAQGDEVRAIELDPGLAGELRAHGVHVARAAYLDDDLVERAAQNVRTIVVFAPTRELLEVVIEGARLASVDRLVLCGAGIPDLAASALTAAGIDHVILATARKTLFKRAAPEDKIAEAVDAADDLAGNPRVKLDLTEPAAWHRLKLDPP